MKEWNTVPEGALALRQVLPRLRVETRARLCAWGLGQSLARAWVMRRAAAYWEAGLGREDLEGAWLDAVACLDLLRWRCGTTADREAVEQMGAMEVGSILKSTPIESER